MMSERSEKNGSKGMTIDVRRLEKEKEEDKHQSKIESLLESLGGDGTLKVFRVENGTPAYCCQMPVDDDLINNLEERIGKMCGAGSYSLRAFHKSKYLLTVPMVVDETMYPIKQSESERKREVARGETPPTTPGLDPISVMTMAREAADRATMEARTQAAQQSASQQQMFIAMMQLQENAAARQLELIRAMNGTNRASEPVENGINTVVNVAKLLETLGYKKPGEDGGYPDDRSMTERILTAVINPIAGKVGDAVSRQLADSMAPPKTLPPGPPPSPAQPSPPVAQVMAGVPNISPDALPKQPARPPTKAKLLTPEEIKAMKERRGPQNVVSPAAMPAPPRKDVSAP